MSLFSPLHGLMPGLKPACWRGLNFYVPEISHEVGRRIIVTYFPGVDDPAIEDIGKSTGTINVRGLIVGDDYVSRALAMQAALHRPGPGTLLHPWLGEMTAIVPSAGGVIKFSAAELRVVRFEVKFQPVKSAGAWGGLASIPALNTLSGVLSSVSSVLWEARAFGAGVLGGGMLGMASWSSAIQTALSSASALSSIISGSPLSGVLGAALAPQLSALRSAVALGPGTVTADTISAALLDLAVPVAEAAIGAAPSAVAPGPRASTAVTSAEQAGWLVSASTVPAQTTDSRTPAALSPVAAQASSVLGPRAGAGLLLACLNDLEALVVQGAAAEAIRIVAMVSVAVHAVRCGVQIEWESRQDATAWRTAMDDAVSRTASLLATTSTAGSAPAGDAARLWRSLDSLRASLGRDMHEVVGRLPSVETYTPPATVSAWQLAQHYAGDDPTQVVAMLDDIARRNRLRHPAAVTDTLEILP